jgi:aquaporin Z
MMNALDLTTTGAPRRWSPMRGGLHLTEWGCELAGTFLLVAGGLSAVVLDFGSGSVVAAHVHSHSLRLLITGFLFAGTGALVTVSPLGRRSGAHLNPAVTFAFWLSGHVHRHDLAGYIGAQCLGAIAGAAFVRLAWGARAVSVHDGVQSPGPGVSDLSAAGLEVLMTAGLVLVIMVCLSSRRTARFTPLAVWVAVTIFVWRGAPYTGTSLNPARSLGPAVVAGDFSHYWVYVAGPLGGAVLAVALLRLVPADVVPLTAKLFHRRGDASNFKAAMDGGGAPRASRAAAA